MTKKDLVALYHQCGGMLHIGRAKDIFTTGTAAKLDTTEIKDIIVRFRKLLTNHIFNFKTTGNIYLCITTSEKEIRVIAASKQGPTKP